MLVEIQLECNKFKLQELPLPNHDVTQFCRRYLRAVLDSCAADFSKCEIPFVLLRSLIIEIHTLEDWQRAELLNCVNWAVSLNK